MHFSALALASLFSLATAAPTAISARWPKANTTTILTPSLISIYHHINGAITPSVTRGEISRENGNGRDNSTLVTFDLTGKTLPAKCSLNFWLETDSVSLFSGTGLIDVFSSRQPAPAGGSRGWGGPGNQRYLPMGRMKANYNGDATVLDFAPNQLKSFPCPKMGDFNVKNGVVGFEVVPVGDWDRVEWDAGVSGLYLSY